MLESVLRKFAAVLSIQLSDEAGGEWVQGHCPLAQWTHETGHDNSMSFGITVGKKKSIFHCFACKESGSVSKLAYLLGRYRKQDVSKIVHNIELAEVVGRGKIEFSDWDSDEQEATKDTRSRNREIPDPEQEFCYPSAAGHPYLSQRGITFRTALSLGLRWDAFRKRILFPVHDRQGRFRGFSGRLVCAASKEQPKVRDYHGLPKREVFLGEFRAFSSDRNLPSGSKKLLVVEGLFDYAKVYQFISELGFWDTHFVCAILGTEITDYKINTLVDLNLPIVWMLDSDKAGDITLYGKINPETGNHIYDTGILHKLYGYVPQFTVKYPKRVNDPGDLSQDQFLQMLAKAKPFFK